MYVNKCVKCGREFETKNPKRVICPDCLYPDKKMMINPGSDSGSAETASSAPSESPEQSLRSYSTEDKPQFYSSYSSGGNDNQNYRRPQQRNNYNNQGGYNNRDGGYRRDNNRQGGYNRNNNGYNRDGGSYNRDGGYNRDNRRGGYNQRPQQGGYNRGGFNNNRRPQGNNRFNNKRPGVARPKAPKQLLVSKEQLEQIELLYKLMLPLPNPDAHEVIGEKIGLEPRKVFFGINLVRQKLMLPKLPFPKRKLAISPDQLFAIKNLYEPLLPLPPIGCHKIIAAQLKMDEWRVHVGIGLIRSQMGLQRWNQDRADVPEEFKNPKPEAIDVAETPVEVAVEAAVEAAPAVEPEKPKRGRKPKKVEETPES